MVKENNLNEELFDHCQKELTVFGEFLGAKQEEKQALMDQFIVEAGRYKHGEISTSAIESSVKRTNEELEKLDNSIKVQILEIKKFARKVMSLAEKQRPIKFSATPEGIVGPRNKLRAPSAKSKPKKKFLGIFRI